MKKYKVNHPDHYNSHPSGIEAIEIVQYMNFCLGNAFKYVYRYRHKNGVEDLKKAIWYLEYQINNSSIVELTSDKSYPDLYDNFLKIYSKEEDTRISKILNYIYCYSFVDNDKNELGKAIDVINELIEEGLRKK